LSKYKVCVYAICKNEEKHVERWMDSMSEADMIIVTDTGSTDGTVSKLRDKGAIVYIDEIKPWRFDKARNVSLAHVPGDADICVCTDLDEVFEPGWRKKLEETWSDDADRGNYLYNWSLKPDGTPDTQFVYFKIHTRTNYMWECPVHEYLKYTGLTPENKVFIEGVVLNHYPDDTKSRGSYLPLLELAEEEEPFSDRIVYYLGREYMYAQKWEKCIETLKKHLALPTATWKEERCASMRWIAKSYFALKDKRNAYKWHHRAVAECPEMREPYIEFAQTAYSLQDWNTTFYMAEEGLKINKKSDVYVNMGYAWDFTPYDLAAISCYWLGMYNRAEEYARKSLAFYPEDERLKKNLKFIQEKMS